MGVRRWLAPEVVQTSAMDCGPAALACLLAGFGVQAGYGRLREACQTDVDGTSIDMLEDLAVALGLDAQQVLLPVDHLLEAPAEALPAILVVRLPNGFTHFVVVWRRHGPLVQVMDPAAGRRWMRAEQLLADTYVHELAVPAVAWRRFADSGGFREVLRARVARLGADPTLVDGAAGDRGWQPLATLDAAARMVATLVAAGGLRPGLDAAGVLGGLLARPETIPAEHWHARAVPGDDEQVRVRGAVLVRVAGHCAGTRAGDLPEPLRAALDDPADRPSRALLGLLRADGLLRPAGLLALVAVAAAGVVAEAVAFRAVFDLTRATAPRAGPVIALLVLLAALVAVEVPLAVGSRALGRQLEARLRLALLGKIPRLPDAYLRSRPTSDMAERSHSLHRLRELPELGEQIVRSALALGFTAAGLIWLYPRAAPLAVSAALVCAALPLAFQSPLVERDLRLRTHEGALSRFVLDGLLGLVAVRAHAGERPLRREHDRLVSEWAATGRSFVRAITVAEAAQFAVGAAFAAGVLLTTTASGASVAEVGRALLAAYWALSMPVLGYDLSLAARRYPALRNVTLRLLEPLGTPEAPALPASEPARPGGAGIAIAFEDVTVVAGGHAILEGVDLRLVAGSHVAVVGRSGAGKSSLVSLLLGWHQPSHGRVLVDDRPLDLAWLREATAWVDPAVQLWNRSLGENLRYGSGDGAPPLDRVLAEARLERVVAALPQGLDTPL
ncbi:MAG: cysteine peptidase family C39 domain-containing protein, partial [Egibacteraceae bacterium]